MRRVSAPRGWVGLWLLLVLVTQHCGGGGGGGNGNGNGGGNGGGGNNDPLTIEPSGPLLLLKGETQRFEANLDDVTWSVDGGDGNGTIDENGVYSHPATLPPDPRVTVRAEASGGRAATAQVDLHTADDIGFSEPQVLNAAPIPDIIFEAAVSTAGVGGGLAVRTGGGSVHIGGTWTGFAGETANLFFAQEIDLGGFSAQRNLEPTGSSQDVVYAQSTAVDSALNPGVLFAGDVGGLLRVSFLGSDDRGATFREPVAVADFIGDQSQFQAAMVLDDSDRVHVVFIADQNPSATQGQAYYVRSDDGGATWGAPLEVGGSAQCFPQIATDPSGETVVICSEVGNCGSGVVSIVRSDDGGDNFSGSVAVSNGVGASFCQVQAFSRDEIFVAYEQRGIVLLAASTDGGGTFPQRTQVNSSQTHLQTEEPGPLPVMSMDSLGRIDIVWSADTDGSEEPDSLQYARSTDGGRTFSPDQTIAGTGGVLIYGLALRHDAGGRAHLQFASDAQVADGEYDVQYMRGE